MAASEEEDEPAPEPMLSSYSAKVPGPPPSAEGAVRNQYVFTIAPDAPAEDRGGISIPAGEEDHHLVSGIIGGDIR